MLRRYKADGTEDPTFVHAESEMDSTKSAAGMVIQKDGRMVVLAFSSGQAVLVRYWG